MAPFPAIFSVAADATEGGDSDNGIGAWLQETVRSAFGWLQGWVSAGEGSSERETADGSPKAPSAPAEAARDAEPKKDPPRQIASNDRSDDDAQDFVEARRKADEEMKEAQRLAEVREKTAEEKRRAKADEALRKEEADLKAREAARKAEAARKHEEYQRRINEGLKKLEEAQKAAEEKRAKEEEAKKASERRAEAEKAAPPTVRANTVPDLRLLSLPKKEADEKATPVPDAANEKGSAGEKTAASEPAATAESKATQSVASEAKPKAERSQSAGQQRAKRAKTQRRTREAKAPRRKARLVYVVKPGDTLSAIAKRYLGSRERYDVIYRANRHKIKNPNVIQAYQRIVVPLRKA
jgi:nucleoid-associated protein YgaU